MPDAIDGVEVDLFSTIMPAATLSRKPGREENRTDKSPHGVAGYHADQCGTRTG
jgi:hypothetical protein